MKMNVGIITPKLAESKAFYQNVLDFAVTFENDFFVLLHHPSGMAEISFLQPDHASQQPLFHPAFPGTGIYLTLEVTDVEQYYERMKTLGVPLQIDLRKEPWGDYHFAIADPNGVGIDLVTYLTPEQA
ncbi:glyoxalase [Siphonobacter sp. BAB-5385]|nr:glyoxalase [Siphonobacter sp. BAB-5385]PMD88766.1 glyoxalase [Siphonobacter sp. BAB-5405]